MTKSSVQFLTRWLLKKLEMGTDFGRRRTLGQLGHRLFRFRFRFWRYRFLVGNWLRFRLRFRGEVLGPLGELSPGRRPSMQPRRLDVMGSGVHDKTGQHDQHEAHHKGGNTQSVAFDTLFTIQSDPSAAKSMRHRLAGPEFGEGRQAGQRLVLGFLLLTSGKQMRGLRISEPKDLLLTGQGVERRSLWWHPSNWEPRTNSAEKSREKREREEATTQPAQLLLSSVSPSLSLGLLSRPSEPIKASCIRHVVHNSLLIGARCEDFTWTLRSFSSQKENGGRGIRNVSHSVGRSQRA